MTLVEGPANKEKEIKEKENEKLSHLDIINPSSPNRFPYSPNYSRCQSINNVNLAFLELCFVEV